MNLESGALSWVRVNDSAMGLEGKALYASKSAGSNGESIDNLGTVMVL